MSPIFNPIWFYSVGHQNHKATRCKIGLDMITVTKVAKLGEKFNNVVINTSRVRTVS